MCGFMAAGAAIGGISSIMGLREQNKEIGRQIAAQNAQKTLMVREMNYNLSSLDQEQKDQFDQAVTTLQGNSVNSIRNQGMIEAALGESNLEGRTMDAVMREVRGQDARVADSIRDSYGKSWTGLQNAKETSIMETQSSLDGMPQIRGPSTFSQILSVGTGALQGAQMGHSLESAYKGAKGLVTKVGANIQMGGSK